MNRSHHHPDFHARHHAVDMEQFAYNQMPKGGYRDVALYRYTGTHLYQWFATKKDSIFNDAFGEPFAIIPFKVGKTVQSVIDGRRAIDGNKDNIINDVVSEYGVLYTAFEKAEAKVTSVQELLNSIKDVSDNPVVSAMIHKAINIIEDS